jgi:hypothetical protein
LKPRIPADIKIYDCPHPSYGHDNIVRLSKKVKFLKRKKVASACNMHRLFVIIP